MTGYAPEGADLGDPSTKESHALWAAARSPLRKSHWLFLRALRTRGRCTGSRTARDMVGMTLELVPFGFGLCDNENPGKMTRILF